VKRSPCPRKAKQPARKATVALRFGPATLIRPENTPDKDQARTVPLWVVDVQEIDPPGGAEAVRWRLLTTHKISTLERARQIVAWYRMRWIIEQVFRSMKADCLRIEDSQLEPPRVRNNARLVRKDRCPAGRMVGPDVQRIPAART
jgi:hypothetical protein